MNDRVLIVAEAAQGFEGDATQARLLARAAAAAGADIVKFQIVYADELARPGYKWYDLYRSLEMPFEAWATVRDAAAHVGVGLAFDAYGPRSLEHAVSLGARAIKVHASDFFNRALLRAVLDAGPDVHLSLGGIEVEEVEQLLDEIGPEQARRLVLLFGYQAEPTPIGANNLARLGALAVRFPDQQIGWMDHADGATDEAEWLGVMAVALGARVIEKHITLTRTLELEDYISALDAEAFRRYVERVRLAEQALGSSSLRLSPEELAYRRRALKVVVAARDLAAGEALSADAVTLARVAMSDDCSPFQQPLEVIGRKAARDLAAGNALNEGDVA